MASTKRAIEADERIPILFWTRLPIRRGGEGFHSSRRAHKVDLWCNGPCWTTERRISVLLSKFKVEPWRSLFDWHGSEMLGDNVHRVARVKQTVGPFTNAFARKLASKWSYILFRVESRTILQLLTILWSTKKSSILVCVHRLVSRHSTVKISMPSTVSHGVSRHETWRVVKMPVVEKKGNYETILLEGGNTDGMPL